MSAVTSADLARDRRHIALGSLRIEVMDQRTCVERIATAAATRAGLWVVTANADIARLCEHDRSIASLVADADLVVADGMPLVWASRILRQPLPERVCGSNLVWSLAHRAAADGFSLFLLGGGAPATAQRAAAVLTERYPGLRIAGSHFPPFGFESDARELERIREALRETRPALVYVALGFPKAERLISELRGQFPEVSWIGVGISLSFVAGEIPRAPLWMQRTGLEWLHRLSKEPRRLIVRYLWHDIPFVIRLLAWSWYQRLRTGGHSKR